LANIRKSLEKEKETISSWSPERVQSLLNDKNFVDAAQKLQQFQNPPQSGLSDEEWSALSEGEKAKFKQIEQKVSQLEQLNYLSTLKQQDEQLKGRYANYEPTKIDEITQSLITGKVQATREDLWKVIDYENAVERAYKLGLQDRNNYNQEKINASSPEGFNTTNAVKLEPNNGEKSGDFFKRILLNNMSRFKSGSKV